MIERIQKGENNTTEFKSTLRWNIKNAGFDPEIEFAVTKTIAAFLNSNGGMLFIGVDDQKTILGLDYDFAIFKKADKVDAFQQHFDQLIENTFDNTVHLFIKFGFEIAQGKQFCFVEVRKASRPIILTFNKKTYFFIRRQGSTVSLDLLKTTVYVLEHWGNQPVSSGIEDMFKGENSFKKQLKSELETPSSVLHEEIKNNWNSYSLIDSSKFLKSIMVDHLPESIDYGMLPIIADFAGKHLNYDQQSKYVYNQEHVHAHLHEDEGYALPAYYPICLVGILYSTAINNKVDINTVSLQLGTMRSIFSSMVKYMITNIDPNPASAEKEYPSNYHWLIGEMLDRADHWIGEFCEKENFDPASSYVESIPAIIGYCFDELYEGEQNGKLDTGFIIRQLYYHCLSTYFSARTNDIMRVSIEEEIIKKIPERLIIPVLKYALDEKFALGVDHLVTGRFGTINSHEEAILNRFRTFLIEHQLL